MVHFLAISFEYVICDFLVFLLVDLEVSNSNLTQTK